MPTDTMVTLHVLVVGHAIAGYHILLHHTRLEIGIVLVVCRRRRQICARNDPKSAFEIGFIFSIGEKIDYLRRKGGQFDAESSIVGFEMTYFPDNKGRSP
uniref:Uncharacterized protein n=1 Tax=Romanomermis culicivorax TaxID=13658 RepID=A0A915J6L0_ROMCU